MQQTERQTWFDKHIMYLAEIFLSLGKDSALTDYKPLEFPLCCTLVTTWASTLLTLQLYRADYNFHPSSSTDQNRNLNLWKRVDTVGSESGLLHVGNTQTGCDSTLRDARGYISFCSTKCCLLPSSSFWLISFSCLVAKLCLQVVSSVSKDVNINQSWAELGIKTYIVNPHLGLLVLLFLNNHYKQTNT